LIHGERYADSQRSGSLSVNQAFRLNLAPRGHPSITSSTCARVELRLAPYNDNEYRGHLRKTLSPQNSAACPHERAPFHLIVGVGAILEKP